MARPSLAMADARRAWYLTPPGWLLAVVLSLSCCAYIGEPLPPALNIPAAVADLEVVQRGGELHLSFTPPNATTEGLALPAGVEAEIRIGAFEQPFEPAAWETAATILPPEPLAAENPRRRVDATPWIGQEVAVGVRYRTAKGRYSGWSNLVGIRVRTPLAPPAGQRAVATAEGIRLTWNPPDGSTPDATAYRIYRDGRLLATVTDPSYLDPVTEPGARFTYQLQVVEERAESLLSAPVTIEYQDRFPPQAPTGLVALAGVATVELAWDPVNAADLAGYRVYRDGELLADRLVTPVFSDTAVVPGRTYHYAVSAFDSRENESGRSAAVKVRLP